MCTATQLQATARS